MSTICKIDPTVRKARAERRGVVRAFERGANNLTDTEQRLQAAVAYKRLNKIRKNPRLTDEQKSDRFDRVMDDLEAVAA